MKVVRGFESNDFAEWKSVIAIGGFDGVHIGHAAILSRLCDMARRKGGKGIVITFDPLPRQFFKRDGCRVITSVDEKLALLEAIGVDAVFIISFTGELSRVEPGNFLERIWGSFHPLGIVVGHNHHFGRGGRGGIPMLHAFSNEKQVDLQVVKDVLHRNEIVSSTRIRKEISEGNVKEAAQMLGRPFSFSALVTRGNGIGTSLAYPTANLEMSEGRKVLPGSGVYAAKASMDGGDYGAMLYLGKRPTFYERGQPSIEAYIMGFEGNLYGKEISVAVIERIREEKKFSSAKNLKDQIMNDEATARKIIKDLAVKQGG